MATKRKVSSDSDSNSDSKKNTKRSKSSENVPIKDEALPINEESLADEALPSTSRSMKTQVEDEVQRRLVGSPVPDEEARQRWPHRYQTKENGSGAAVSATSQNSSSKGYSFDRSSNGEKEENIQPKHDFTQAKIDSHAKAAFEERLRDVVLTQTQDAENREVSVTDLSPVDETAIWADTVGGPYKGRIYGLGQQSFSSVTSRVSATRGVIYEDELVTALHARLAAMEAQLQEERIQREEERIRREEERIRREEECIRQEEKLRKYREDFSTMQREQREFMSFMARWEEKAKGGGRPPKI